VDNRGDYRPSEAARRANAEIIRPGQNLRWIGSANYGLERASREGLAVCIVLNNDIEISPEIVAWLCAALEDCSDAALAGPVYDCYWPHQRKALPDGGVERYVPTRAYRDVPFCDGTAVAVSVEAAREIGLLDAETFAWHGYGADIDYGIRIRQAGMRSVVTEGCYVTHARRGTIRFHEPQLERRIRDEYEQGLTKKWGSDWRWRAGIHGPLVDPLWDEPAGSDDCPVSRDVAEWRLQPKVAGRRR
jgi:GT2 family glycosyltransferase